MPRAATSRRIPCRCTSGETLNLDALRERLALAGYAAVTQVAAHGEFAVRGSLLDVFPMGSESPYRIDLLDRDVDSIRFFDPDTQRSGEKLERIHLLPARETPLSPDAVREFRRRYRLRFPGDLTEHAVYRDVSAGRAPGGWSSTCRCSSSEPRICSSICRRRAC